MMILVHSAPPTLADYRTPNLGVLSSPRRFYRNVDGWAWAADNDAYSKWNGGRYLTMLDGIADLPRALFVTAPDVVGDAKATLAAFRVWRPILAQLRHPIALVAQDGMTSAPWDQIDALFIGGTSVWKMGDGARALVAEARRRGLWVHFGRVNSHQRVRYAKSIGCDSIDGSSLNWFRDRWLRDFLAHADAPTQLMIGDAS
jgi:hypothetical protein